MYDGKPLTAKQADVTMPEGFENYTAEVTVEGSVTNVDQGSVTNTITGVIIRDEEGNDVTDQFKEITKNNGKLTVTPKAVTLVSETATKEYDGTPLEKPMVTGQDGFVAGEVSKVVATGTITEEDSVKNIISFTKENGFKDSNYKITKEEGTLTVNYRMMKRVSI